MRRLICFFEGHKFKLVWNFRCIQCEKCNKIIPFQDGGIELIPKSIAELLHVGEDKGYKL